MDIGVQASVNELVRWLSLEDARTLLRCMEASDLQAAELVLQVCFGTVPDWVRFGDSRIREAMLQALHTRTQPQRAPRVRREALPAMGHTPEYKKYNIA